MTMQTPRVGQTGDQGLKPGFLQPVFDAQSVFRALLNATAYPGRVIALDRIVDGPLPLNAATAALCLVLLDFETPAWLDEKGAACAEACNWLRFHCGMPLTDELEGAQFAIVTDAQDLPPLSAFHSGLIEFPERSTTLVIQVPSLTDGPPTCWSGPGIRSEATVRIAGLPPRFWSDWELNSELYPRGLDIFFTSGTDVISLPRTIRVEA